MRGIRQLAMSANFWQGWSCCLPAGVRELSRELAGQIVQVTLKLGSQTVQGLKSHQQCARLPASLRPGGPAG